MTKAEYLKCLSERISGLPESEKEKFIGFYSEMIDDRIEDGLTKAEAVSAAGSVDDAVRQIAGEIPFQTLVKNKKEKAKHKKINTWEIILIIMGFPMWFPLILALLAVVLAVIITFWAVLVSLYAANISFALSGVAAVGGVWFFFSSNIPVCLMAVSCGLILAGISVFGFLALIPISKLLVKLCRKIFTSFKASLI